MASSEPWGFATVKPLLRVTFSYCSFGHTPIKFQEAVCSGDENEMAQCYQRNPAAETAPLGAGLVVLEPNARKFCALNVTSTFVWSRLKEPASPEQLAKEISEHFQDISETDALRDVQAIIEEMSTLGIIQPVM